MAQSASAAAAAIALESANKDSRMSWGIIAAALAAGGIGGFSLARWSERRRLSEKGVVTESFNSCRATRTLLETVAEEDEKPEGFASKLLEQLKDASLGSSSATSKSPMVAPRLPVASVKLIRCSWENTPKEPFAKEFLIRLGSEDTGLRNTVDDSVFGPDSVVQFIQLLVDLLDPESMPRLERVMHAAATLSTQGGLRMQHLGAVKRALTRTIVGFIPEKKDKKKASRVWEAFFYAMAAVAAPHLAMTDSVSEYIAATAAPLSTPAGGTAAAAVAAQGAALLEMCLGITHAQTEGKKGESVTREVVLKLSDVRACLIKSAQDDANTYCGLLCSVYAHVEGPLEDSQEKERGHWQSRATELSLEVVEHSLDVAKTCLPHRKDIMRSLGDDWLAGVRCLQTAVEISMHKAESNIKFTSEDRGDLKTRLTNLRDETRSSNVWKELLDYS